MATIGDKLQKATDPTRGPMFPFVEPIEQMLGIIPRNAPAQPDTSWHDQMVQQANQSFANQQQQQAPPARPMIRMKLPPRRGM